MNKFLHELQERGLVSQLTNESTINALLNEGTTLYCGFDPTADSLHVGSLLPLITLLRFKLAGHTIFPLIGGATGMIGDPSGKAKERTLNTEETVNHFKASITSQIKSVLGDDIEVVDNLDWTAQLSVLDFLRDIGKHFSVNAMLSKDSVRSRIEREEQGISFTEFSYQLLQSMDFHHLHKTKGCNLQLGGSDQWGNITSGIDLIHKKESADVKVAGITIPLLVKSNGEKFGKSETGAVWLSAEKTSPFDFFQFWLNVSDEDVKRFFKMFSFRSVSEIDKILAEDESRDKPLAQRLLAIELTELVHGKAALESVLHIAKALFESNFDSMTEVDFIELERSGIKSVESSEMMLIPEMVNAGLAKSRTQAREFLKNGAVAVNGKRISIGDEDINNVCITDIRFGRFAILQRGKKEFRLIKFIS